jgi:hypothetical protein
MLPLAIKVVLREADVSQQRRYGDIVFLEKRYCEPRAVPSYGWQSLLGPFLSHVLAPLRKLTRFSTRSARNNKTPSP